MIPTRRATSPTATAAAVLALAAAAWGCGMPPAPAPTNPIRILLANDVYVADTLADGTGGVARVAAVRDRLALEGPVLFVLAGDVLSPSLLSKYYHGRQMVDAFNGAGLNYATFGNHEFELDRDTLVARIAESKFKWLSANCTEASGTRFPGVLPWDTVRVYNRKVGLFGLTLPGDYRRYVRCANPDSAATVAVDTLLALGADLIVGVTHQTVAADRGLLTREPRIDLILGGHEHQAHDVVLGTRHVLKADANARSAQFATVWGEKGQWRQAVRLLTMRPGLPLDTAVTPIVARWQDSLRARLGPERPVGTLEAPLDARDRVSRNGESALGNLVTDAIRAGTGADVALINAGTLRLDDVLPAGPITNYDLESIFLFADETRIVTFPLSGARLREVLEHGVSPQAVGSGAFLQVSGVQFAYDATRPAGSRIVDGPRRANGAAANGAAIAPADTLTVAFSIYPTCQGGDGYRLPEAQGTCPGTAAPRAVDLLMRYLSDALGGRIAPPATGRIVRR